MAPYTDIMGIKAVSAEQVIIKKNGSEKIIALAGNPNVGKSTLFNALTGLNQHTGNWPGKTVANAQGRCRFKDQDYIMVDLPGCYSLMAHSAEEEVARDFICFEKPDAVIVVCDAACLERNLNLALQAIEITPNVVVCVNLMDEAKKKNIDVDIAALSRLLGVPVAATAARSGKGLDNLMDAVGGLPCRIASAYKVTYPGYIEDALSELIPYTEELCGNTVNGRWLALKLLENDPAFLVSIDRYLDIKLDSKGKLSDKLNDIEKNLALNGITARHMKDSIAESLVKSAEGLSQSAVVYRNKSYDKFDREIDKILTSKLTGFPMMFLALAAVFWITITGANYPSQFLSNILFWIENQLLSMFARFNAPAIFTNMIVLGIYRVLAWVVSVMLPPMAIFFPLFTLLEDLGYLPRVAFNLDKVYKKCRACGKQALTMCMGFGCNAAGVIGCRIIDSPRERLIAIITNNFVPCNGRFPPPSKG